jgi:hypothetical protein
VRKLGLGALALAAMMASAVTTGAHAAPVTGPDGRKCGFNSVTDPGTEGGDVQTGEINGGPLVGTGTLTCTIQVGGAFHDDPDNGASASASGAGVVALPPTLVSYNSPENVPVFLCTSFTTASGTIYWVPGATPLEGAWTSNAHSLCGLATSAGTDDLEPYELLLDQIICPVLATLEGVGVPGVVEVGDQGDVFVAGDLFWDCPPYLP